MARPQLSQFNYSAFSGSPEATRFCQRKRVSYFTKGDVVLDVGCGEADFLEFLKDAGIEAIGLERSELMLSKLQKKSLNMVQGDSREFLKGKANAYNGIFCDHLIEHLTPDEALGLLGDAFDALKPGGILIVITPNLGSIEAMSERFWLDLTHTRPYPLPLLKEIWLISRGLRSWRAGSTGTPEGQRAGLTPDIFSRSSGSENTTPGVISS